jgi:hypothetical protein
VDKPLCGEDWARAEALQDGVIDGWALGLFYIRDVVRYRGSGVLEVSAVRDSLDTWKPMGTGTKTLMLDNH